MLLETVSSNIDGIGILNILQSYRVFKAQKGIWRAFFPFGAILSIFTVAGSKTTFLLYTTKVFLSLLLYSKIFIPLKCELIKYLEGLIERLERQKSPRAKGWPPLISVD
jgi:hypothetical protein